MASEEDDRVVVIDDNRIFGHQEFKGCYYLRSSDDALLFLTKMQVAHFFAYGPGIVDLWLDHDLGEDDNVMTVVWWLIMNKKHEYPLSIQHIYIHSMNTAAAHDMLMLLGNVGYDTVRVPLPRDVTTWHGVQCVENMPALRHIP